MPYTRPIAALVYALFFASAALAADPVAPATTSWRGTATFKGKLVGGGGSPGPVDLAVDFGPNGGFGLGAGEFRITADDGMETFAVEGTFAVDAKGQPVLTPDTLALEDQLEVLLLHICQDILMLGTQCDLVALFEVEVDPAKVQLKAKTNAGNGDGATLALAAKLPFVLMNGTDAVRVSFSMKSSPPAELVK